MAQFGMLRAQGAQPSQIRRVVVAEAMLLCAAAVPLGLAMAALVAKTVVGMAAKTLSTQALNVNTVEEARTLLVSSTSVPWAALAAAAGCAHRLPRRGRGRPQTCEDF
ncbi:MAG: FtsX-like permease family protein [Bacillota bacterium]